MDSKEYKNFHEDYMKNNTGTSLQECLMFTAVLPVVVFLTSWITSFVPIAFCFAVQTISFHGLLLFVSFIFPDINHKIYLHLFLIACFVLLAKLDLSKVKILLNTKMPRKKNIITGYRASTNLLTCFCILAVDFTMFPKRMAKTETFGFGVMDFGVGFFICSNGLVEKSSSPKVSFKVLKKVGILLILGILRVISLKYTDYHEHVSEYGVHWNFFFTLAMCHLITHVSMVLTNSSNTLLLSIVFGVTHQVLLYFGLQDWVLSDISRNNFLSANREGIVSCLGYVSLFSAASSLGKLVTNDVNITYKNLLKKLVVIGSIVWIVFFVFCEYSQVSRRLVNLGYILWTVALSFTVLALFILEELCTYGISTKKTVRNLSTGFLLFECVNANNLFFFLFANLLTGLVNTCFQTLLLGKLSTLLITSNYVLVLCAVTYYLYVKKIYLFKF